MLIICDNSPQQKLSGISWVRRIMSMTITEKIIAKSAGKNKVIPGESVWLNVDILMTHDVCGPPTIDIWKREFGSKAKIWDTPIVTEISAFEKFYSAEVYHQEYFVNNPQNQYVSGHIKSVKYYPVRLTNNQLKALTQ